MSNEKIYKEKLTLMSLILMIFTSVFGFTNIARAFLLMGYSAIPWYILSAITFFIPYSFMLAEYGAAFRKERGGIYSWMNKSVGSKYAFIVTFMWYTSYLIWMVSTSSSIWVPFSNVLFGQDTTSTWSIFGLSSPKTLALLASAFVIFVTYTASKGLDNIKKVTSIGGTVVALSNIVLLIGSVVVLALNKFKLAEPIKTTSFFTSPNPSYQSPIGVLGFTVFALFAYGGLEAVGGLVDQTENPKKTFPKGIKISAIIIALGYSIGILCVGFFTNWQNTLSSDNVNMANVLYIIMSNLGYTLGISLNLSTTTALTLGVWIARFIGLSMFLALLGAFFTLIYSPVKQLIEGTPNEIWPKSWIKLDKNNMPRNAMWIQCAVVVGIIIVSSLGGDTTSKFLNYLILMSNVSMTIPYIFIDLAFISFKRNNDIEKPFIFYKSYNSSVVWSIIVAITITFANIFTIIQPILTTGDYVATLFQVSGPLLFSIIAILIYNKYEKNIK